MATSIGHSLAGLAAVGVAPRHRLIPVFVAAVLMANAPDLDFLPGVLVGMPALYHQGISHSLGCAVLASVVAAFVLRRLDVPFGVAFRVSFVAYATHLALDLLGPDRRPPSGIPVFWPLSESHFISPVTLLPGVHHVARSDASIDDWLRGILVARNLGAIAIETVLLAPVAWLASRRSAILRAFDS